MQPVSCGDSPPPTSHPQPAKRGRDRGEETELFCAEGMEKYRGFLTQGRWAGVRGGVGIGKTCPQPGAQDQGQAWGDRKWKLWVAQQENLDSEQARCRRQEAETQDHAFDTHSHSLPYSQRLRSSSQQSTGTSDTQASPSALPQPHCPDLSFFTCKMGIRLHPRPPP